MDRRARHPLHEQPDADGHPERALAPGMPAGSISSATIVRQSCINSARASEPEMPLTAVLGRCARASACFSKGSRDAIAFRQQPRNDLSDNVPGIDCCSQRGAHKRCVHHSAAKQQKVSPREREHARDATDWLETALRVYVCLLPNNLPRFLRRGWRKQNRWFAEHCPGWSPAGLRSSSAGKSSRLPTCACQFRQNSAGTTGPNGCSCPRNVAHAKARSPPRGRAAGVQRCGSPSGSSAHALHPGARGRLAIGPLPPLGFRPFDPTPHIVWPPLLAP